MVAARYEVLRLLGQGGTGRVLLVRDHLAESRMLALKELDAGSDDPDQLAALAREYRVLTHLRHPNLVEVLDFALTPHPHLTMELVDGLPLGEVELDDDELVQVVVQVCRALEYVHARGLVHLDVKPTNILVERIAGQVHARLVDFGVATESGAGEVAGYTVGYVAPEVAAGLPYDGRADLYALGRSLLSLTQPGAPHFDADTVVGELPADSIDIVGGDLAGLPASLAPTVARLIRFEPAERHASAAQVIDELARATGEALTTETAATRTVHLEPSRLVGKETVLATLDQRRHGSGQVELVGPSGVGKSAVLREVRLRARLDGDFVVSVDAAGGGRVLHAIVAALAGAALGADAATRRELAGLAPRLFPDEIPWAAGPLRDEHAARVRLHDAIARLVAAAAQTAAVVILVENADQLDPEVDTLLGRIAELDRVLVVRAAETARGRGEVLTLAPLDEAGIAALLAQIVGEGVIPTSLVPRIAALAEGHGGVVSELCKLFADVGILTRTAESRWRFDGERLEAIGLPVSAEAVAEDRIAALPIRLQRALEAGSLLGRRFDPRVVADALDGDGGELHELVERRFLAAEGRELAFERGAIARAALARVSRAPSTPRLRVRLAVAWSRRRGDVAGIASLFLESERPELAVEPLVELAESASAAFDFARAAAALDRALGLAPSAALHRQRLAAIRRGGLGDAPLRREEALAVEDTAIRLELAAIALMRSDFRAALDDAGAALRAQPTRSQTAWAHRHRAMALYGRGELAEALAALDAGLAAVAPEDPVTGRLLTDRGLVHAYAGELERALDDHRAALAHVSDDEGRAAVLSNLGFAEWQLGRLGDARRHLDEALTLRRRMGDPFGAAVTTNNLGNVYRHVGAAPEAEAAYREAIALARRSGSRLYEAIAWNNLGQLLENDERFAEALPLYERALAMARVLGDRIREGDNLANLGACRLALGDVAAALRELEGAVRLRESLGDHAYLVLDRSFLARALVDARRPEEAAAAIDASLRELSAGQTGVEAVQVVWANAATVYAALGRHEDAARARQAGRAEVLRQAEAIDDPALRESFLARVRVNRELGRG
jgi:tetratricopeptide (TPR) repeat protein